MLSVVLYLVYSYITFPRTTHGVALLKRSVASLIFNNVIVILQARVLELVKHTGDHITSAVK